MAGALKPAGAAGPPEVHLPVVAARPCPPRPRPHRWRIWALQAALLAMLGLLLLLLAHNTALQLQARGIPAGWDFLWQSAGFDIGETLIEFSAADALWRALLVGVLNTLKAAIPGVLLCTLLGVGIGLGRLARHPWVRGLCSAYVEVFRNVPLLVQLLLWYLLLLESLPDFPVQGVAGLVLSKSGVALPALALTDGLRPDWPVIDGLMVSGGWQVSPEYLALLTGLATYTAAFVAELVRAGVSSVPRAMRLAAESLGLSRRDVMRYVLGPLALRVVVPPLANQYLNLLKNSSLAVAIGYPDLVSVTSTTLNQTGRALECMVILMAVYLLLSLLTAAIMHGVNRRIALRGVQHAR